MVLERKLSAAKGALNTLGDRIAGLQRQLDHFDLQSETLLSAMAGIYVDVISPLGPRIRSPVHLPYCKARRFRQSTRLAAGRYPCRRAVASGWRWPPAVNVFVIA